MKRIRYTMTGTILLAGIALAAPSVTTTPEFAEQSAPVNEVLEWNHVFIDTLIATNTANSSSQRLGAIVHAAIFDAYNGIERRYTPIFVHDRAPGGSSRQAAVVAAAYRALRACSRLNRRCSTCAMRLRWRRSAISVPTRSMCPGVGTRARSGSSVASPGALRWRTPCSPGGRPTASARPTLHSTAGA